MNETEKETEWINLDEGLYHVEKALLVAADKTALIIYDASLDVYVAAQGPKNIRGEGRVVNMMVVDLLEECDQLDLILDLGGDHVYRLGDVDLKAGKVFAPNVKSRVLYAPKKPWVHMGRAVFERLEAEMELR